MPQMSPMWWTTLLINFNLSLIIFSIMNFFTFMPKIRYTLLKMSNTKLIWKW